MHVRTDLQGDARAQPCTARDSPEWPMPVKSLRGSSATTADREISPHADGYTRRTCLQMLVGVAGGAACPALWAAADNSGTREGVTFSFGTYGMQALKTEAALRALAQIGYDGVELAVRPDWDAAPANLSAERRQSVRRLLDELGLELTAFMEHLYPSRDEAEHAAALERLRHVMELGHDLRPAGPPLIQTVLGGGAWEEQKAMFVDRLGAWGELGQSAQVVIAVKPHRGGALSQPAEAAWLLRQLGETPWLRMVYDYSHYAFRELPLEETIRTALPYTAHIAIKDAVRMGDAVRFVLPGESGTFAYESLFQQFYAGGYRGDICCEVSGMVSSQPGYDPLAAAQRCYANIAPRFASAQVPRRRA